MYDTFIVSDSIVLIQNCWQVAMKLYRHDEVFHKNTSLQGYLNPFVLECIIPAEPLNDKIKWRHLEDISGLVTHLLVPSFGQNGSSKDFITYSCFLEEL